MPENLYILLDAARMGRSLGYAKKINNRNESLFLGRKEESLDQIAPCLFSVASNHPFSAWLGNNSKGKAWGIFMRSSLPMEDLLRHLRKFITVLTEDHQEYYFRFYDPRVLRIFLPTCDGNQLNEFFGPVVQYICEDEDPDFFRIFSLAKDALQETRIPYKELFPEQPLMIPDSSEIQDPAKAEEHEVAASNKHAYICFEGDAGTLRNYLSGLTAVDRSRYFLAAGHYYVIGGTENQHTVFSLATDESIIEEFINDEELKERLTAAESRKQEDELLLKDSIMKKRHVKETEVGTGQNGKKKNQWLGWIKI